MERTTQTLLAILALLTLVLPSLPMGGAAEDPGVAPDAPPAWDPALLPRATDPVRAPEGRDAGPSASSARDGAGALATCDVPGPDASGYACASATYSWLDTTGGTTLTLGDDAQEYVNLPFTFPWYGGSATWAYVGSNGIVCLSSSSCTGYVAQALPDVGTPNPAVACFWEDLNPAAGGTIRYKTVGTAPSRTFVVEWNNVPHYNSAQTNTFQTQLLEGGEVRCMLQNVKSDADGQPTGVGVEDWYGSVGVRYKYGEFAVTNTGLRFGIQPKGAINTQVTSKVAGTGCTQPASSVEFDIRDSYLVHWINYRVDVSPMDVRRVVVNDDTGVTWIDDVRTHNVGTGTWCAAMEQPMDGSFFQAHPGRYHVELYFSNTAGAWVKQGSNINFNVWPKLTSGGVYKNTVGDGVTTFYTNEQYVRVFTKWSTTYARTGGHTIKYHWYRDGWTEHAVNGAQTMSSGLSLVTLTNTLDIQASGAWQYPGTWTVRPWLDSDTNYVQAAQYTFTIATAPAVPPSEPQGLAVSAPSYAKLRLDWSAPASTGGAAITSYRVYGGDSAGSLSFLGSVSGTQLWYENTGLVPGLRYYQVSAVNSAGEGARSSTASGRAYADYTIELRAWIPDYSVIDPIPETFNNQYWPTHGADATAGNAYCYTHWNPWLSPPLGVEGWHLGDDHFGYDGTFRVRSLLHLRWDGAALSDVYEPAGARYGESVQYRRYMDTVFSETCELARETATSASGARSLSSTSFSLDYESENPIMTDYWGGSEFTPSIDGTLTGTFASNGDLELRYTTDQFPSHAFRVTRNGATQLTVTSTEAWCVDGEDMWALKSALESQQPERTTVLHQTDAASSQSYPSEAC